MLGAAQFLIGAAILALIAAIADGPPLNAWTVNFVIALLTLALLGTALPYVLWFAELRWASIDAVMFWTLLVPVVGLVLSVLVLGESLTVQAAARYRDCCCRDGAGRQIGSATQRQTCSLAAKWQ